MPLLTAQEIRKSYRGDIVLDGVSLTLEPRRYGLVGPNGCGKSTLARILAGELSPDRGSVVTARSTRVVYLPQRADLTPGRTAREEALAAFEDLVGMEERLSALQAEMGREDLPPDEREAVVARHDRLLTEFELRGGWERERRAEKALDGLGVPPEVRGQDVATLSGGQATRVCLARALLAEPDLLILDEPTNHLDIDAAEWLEGYLLSRRGASLVISHDRWLLDRVAERVFELERGRLFSYPGNYTAFERLRAERRHREETEYRKQQEHIRKEEEFIRRNIAAQRVSMARGKRKRLERLTRLSAPESEGGRMAIPDTGPDSHGSDVVELTGVAVGYGERRVIEDLDLRVPRGQRLGITGPNGAGKTTLLRLVAGEVRADSGRVTFGRKVRLGYLRQEPDSLVPGRTVLETAWERMPGAERGEVRAWLARFLFRQEEVEKDVGRLSGGEAARLALALLFLDRPNLLLLDEPTNHLDIRSRQALEEALRGFAGTVLLVTHDRYLLDAVADAVLEVRAGRTLYTLGDWSRHAERRAELLREARPERTKAAPERPSAETRPGKVKNPWRFARLEEEIMAVEARIEEVKDLMTREEVYRDPDRIRALKDELPALEGELKRLNEEWEGFIP